MSASKTYWAYIISTCLLIQCLISPVISAPSALSKNELESRQSALTPSQFALAATRFIVMLPFLPIMMAIPGVTAVVMPLFMALQDRLTTMIPNLPSFLGNINNNNNNQQGGSVTNFINAFSGLIGGGGNQNNQQGSATGSGSADAASETPSFFRFKRSLLKLPTKALNEGFREVFDFLHKTDDVINQLTSSQPDCRRQAVCRLYHSFDPSIGSFLGNMIQVFRLDSKVEKLDVSDTARAIIKDVLKAANTGLYRQDCSSVYSRCSITVKSKRN